MKFRVIIAAILVYAMQLSAQVIDWTPYFATPNDTITIIYDASLGSSGLVGVFPVYAHTGVVTNLSTSSSDWKYVKTTWGQNTPETMLTSLGGTKWQIKIKPSSYYAVPAGETILKLAFVFRNAAGTLTGKESDGSDIFLPMAQPGLNIKLVSPSTTNLYNLNDSVTIKGVASNDATSIKLYANGIFVAEYLGTSMIIKRAVSDYSKVRIKIIASNAQGATKSDSGYYLARGPVVTAEVPANMKDGINYTSNSSATLVLYAPLKQYVYAIGDFNNWEYDPLQYMKRSSDGNRYWVELNNLTPGTEYAYQYLVDNKIRVGDPFADKVLDPWNDSYIESTTYPNLKPYPTGKTSNVVTVLQTAQTAFSWQVTNFVRPPKEKLVIYECLIRDFTAAHSYKSVMDTLDYLVRLGVTALQLMPVIEFEGNLSWGYNPDFFFAPDKYYGTKDDLKKLVDKCHQKGIAVIFDVVLNHAFGLNSWARLWWDDVNNRPASNSPFFNTVATHPYSVGNDFNHESQATKDLVDRFLKYWVTEFKADGFRFDLSKGFTQTNSGGNVGLWGQKDQTRISLLNRMSTAIRQTDPNIYLILEHFANDDEEQSLSSSGFMLWANNNSAYSEAAMGWHDSNKSDFSRVSYKNHGFTDANAIGYMESHDEERLMFKNISYGNSNGGYNTKEVNTAINRMKLASAFFYTVPGPKMLWQFGELGFDLSINYPCGTDACRLSNKPPKWEYYSISERNKLFKTVAALTALKKNYPAFSGTEFQTYVSGAGKRIYINHASMNVNIIGNFDVVAIPFTPYFANTGKWYDYFSGDSINVVDTQSPINLAPGEFKIYTTVKLPTPEQGIASRIEKTDEAIGREYELMQNYPNPVSLAKSQTNTQIQFTIKNPGKVKISVYNTLGQEITKLVDEDMSSGKYSLDYDTSSLSNGIYFYRMMTGTVNLTRKLVVVK